MSRGPRIASVVVASLLGVWFLVAGSQKFLAAAVFKKMFADFGLPLWLVPVIGVLELTGAVLVLVPHTARFGAVVIATVMVGAVGSHLMSGIGSPVAALAALAMAGFVAVVRFRHASAAHRSRHTTRGEARESG